jgi:serine/threonine protein kinase/Tol biopolymer transport system component
MLPALSRYRILNKLGAGGMGEVYLAEDTRLHRRVALKFLPTQFTTDATRVRRFEKEARAASALNHPNILTIHEIGEADGAHFIATEFVEGTTLRQRLSLAPFGLIEALDVAIQVAAALQAAHAIGVVHRDIKPENLMLRHDGYVKVLDFGLAKFIENATASDSMPTQAATQTEPGLAMGTTPYMSPEQTRGLRVDARTDIWSLGVVLYEMITGHLPFTGETRSDILAAILKSEPMPLATYAPHAPIELRRIVSRMLGKDCGQRYQNASELLVDLRALKRTQEATSSQDGALVTDYTTAVHEAVTIIDQNTTAPDLQPATRPHTDVPQTRVAAPRWWWMAALIAALLIAAWLVFRWGSRSEEMGANLLSQLSTAQITSWKSDLGEDLFNWARFSPDSKFIAFSSTRDGNSSIWIKQLSGGDPITSNRDKATDFSPIWSPDGQQIAFLSNRDEQSAIWVMPAFGGTPTPLKPLPQRGQGLVAWSKDAKTIYYEFNQNLYALDVASKQSTALTDLASSTMPREFSLSPDGERMAYADTQDQQKDIWVAPLRGGAATRITNDRDDDGTPIWLPDGKRLIYSSVRNGVQQICVAYLDGRAPVQITFGDNDHQALDVSADGTKILYATTRDESDLWSVRLDNGKESQLTADIGVELWPDLSPDNATVAYQVSRATSVAANLFNCLILTQPLSLDGPQRQVATDGLEPRWSPDGNQLAFLRRDNSQYNLWTVRAAGGDAHQLTTGGILFGGFSLLPYNLAQTQDYQWSPDGRSLVYCARQAETANVFQVAADGSSVTPLSTNQEANLLFFNPAWSPDGKRLAWLARDASRRSWSVWLRDGDRSAPLFQSDTVLRLVGWSASGQELIIKSIAGSNDAGLMPEEVRLFALPLAGGSPRPIAQLKAAFIHSIQLSPDRKEIAFAARENGEGSLGVVPASGGEIKTVIRSNDARVYYSGLAWAADGKTLYYSKQANWRVLSLIDHFK